MTPKLIVPAGACDTHVHIFGAEVLAASASKLPIADLAGYLVQRARLGIKRTVLVQPTAFKFDNTGILRALLEIGENARGVVMIDRSISESELRRLTGLGVRGARFHLLKSELQSWDDLEPIAERIAAHGWHIQLQCDGRHLPDRAALLARLPAPLVIDQGGKFVEPVQVNDPAFHALLGLVDRGTTYVKLSAPYEVSKVGPPDYGDVGELARALVRAGPDRMLWASNWPHHSMPADRRPDDTALLDLLLDWAPNPSVRRKILVDNPARLYGFAPC